MVQEKKVCISFLLNKERNWVYKKQSLKLASLDSQNISTASSTAVVLAPYSLPWKPRKLDPFLQLSVWDSIQAIPAELIYQEWILSTHTSISFKIQRQILIHPFGKSQRKSHCLIVRFPWLYLVTCWRWYVSKNLKIPSQQCKRQPKHDSLLLHACASLFFGGRGVGTKKKTHPQLWTPLQLEHKRPPLQFWYCVIENHSRPKTMHGKNIIYFKKEN